MDRVKEKLSIERYIYCVVGVIILLCGLIYLLSSCKEIVDGPSGGLGKGVRVPVNFSVHIGSQGNDQSIEPRSYNTQKEPVTDFVRIKDDVYMYATFEEEHPVTTRAMTTDLPNGSLVRIVAYTTASTPLFVDSATYIATSNELSPISSGIFVPDGASYIFVAYSLNDNIIPAQNIGSPTLTIPSSLFSNPEFDLLWGKTTSPISSSSEVAITLYHKFARVRVQASSAAIIPTAPIRKIENAHVNPSYRGQMTLDVVDGTLTPQSSTPNSTGAMLTDWRTQGTTLYGSGSNLNATNVESDYCYIFTNGSNKTVLKIGNLNVGNNDLGAYEFGFSNTELIPGHSYTMKLNFKRLVWAGSNIYWDGTKLTFLPETITDENLQGMQGVYFMWGSLIGMSPRSISSTPPEYVFSDTSTKLYVPLIQSPNRAAWDVQYAGVGLNNFGWTSMANIPNVSGGSLVSQSWLDDHRTRNYLSDEAHTPATLRGDICKFLTDNKDAPPGGEWRMPNSREFGLTADEYTNAVGSYPNPSTLPEDGTFNFRSIPFFVMRTTSSSSTIFPVGGARSATGVIRTDLQLNSFYLSGSPASSNSNTIDRCYVMNPQEITTSLVQGNASTTATYSIESTRIHAPVRCVKIEGNAIYFNFGLPTADVEDWDAGGTLGDSSSGTEGQGDLWY